MKSPYREQMIWTENGVWLQQGEKISFVGKLSLCSVQDFCRERKLWLTVDVDRLNDQGARRRRVSAV